MINFNGKIIPQDNAPLSYKNRGLAFGDAVFETLRVVSGKILFWEDHYLRLMASMRIMRMEIPMSFTMEQLEEELLQTAAQAHPKERSLRAKLTVFRNEGGFYTPTDCSVSYMMEVTPLASAFYLLDTRPYEVELFKDHYVPAELLSTIKSNNKLVQVLAGIYAKENDYANCLLLNEKKQVVEFLNGNLFLVSGKTIKTPPIADGCLRGVMRKQLLDLLKKLPDYTVEEVSVSPFELQKADEMFMTNTITGIQPVSQYRKKHYKTQVAQDLLGKLNAKIRLMG